MSCVPAVFESATASPVPENSTVCPPPEIEAWALLRVFAACRAAYGVLRAARVR